MTNAKQIKWLFRSLLARNPDLIQVEPGVIWIRPIRHFAAKIWVKRCLDPNIFDSNMSLTTLYWDGSAIEDPFGSFVESFSRKPLPAPFTREYFLQPQYELRPEFPQLAAWGSTVGRWDWRVPDIDRIFTCAVEEQVLPLLRPLAEDHRAYLPFFRKFIIPGGRVHAEQQVAIALASGARDEARTLLAQIWRWYETDSHGDYEQPDQIVYPKPGQRKRAAIEAWEKASLCVSYRKTRRRILEIVEPLRTGDRAALAAILHRWEAEAARIHGVERWWEPTPFPIEEGLG